MSTLYEITGELLGLEALFEAKGGELTDEELAAYLKLEEDFTEKVDRTIAFIREVEARAAARAEEARRLSELARSDQNLAERLKAYIMAAMKARGVSKLETPRFRVSVRMAGGKQPITLKVTPDELPERFQRIVVHPDMEAIRQALEAGDFEAASVAEFAERKEYLAIK